jgi:hypothetical protein
VSHINWQIYVAHLLSDHTGRRLGLAPLDVRHIGFR